MDYLRMSALGLAVIGLGLFGSAAPGGDLGELANAAAAGDNPNAPILVHGCNRGWQLAYVPRWGVTAWHRHVGPR